jgi:ubiquinone biosynthesis protein COQ9
MNAEDTRERLLAATLTQVAFEGWTDRAIRMAAAELGLSPAAAELAFPGGVTELIGFWSATADREMEAALAGSDLAAMTVHERIATAVRIRLDLVSHQREAVRRAIAFLALPSSGLQAFRCTYATINAIWYAAGDTATDFSFYTKRASLAGVYSATVLYWLDDDSDGCAATWSFLDRRLGDVMRLQRLRRGVTGVFDRLTQPLLPLSPFRR